VVHFHHFHQWFWRASNAGSTLHLSKVLHTCYWCSLTRSMHASAVVTSVVLTSCSIGPRILERSGSGQRTFAVLGSPVVTTKLEIWASDISARAALLSQVIILEESSENHVLLRMFNHSSQLSTRYAISH
jgi:hypothetical protein